MVRKSKKESAVGSDVAEESKRETGFYEPYVNFARVLRTWFVAYGIGGPVVLLTGQNVAQAILHGPLARTIGYCFLVGVFFQVFHALLNKAAMWYLYIGEIGLIDKSTRRYQLADRFSECFVFELLFDLGTIFLFGLATLKALWAVAP